MNVSSLIYVAHLMTVKKICSQQHSVNVLPQKWNLYEVKLQKQHLYLDSLTLVFTVFNLIQNKIGKLVIWGESHGFVHLVNELSFLFLIEVLWETTVSYLKQKKESLCTEIFSCSRNFPSKMPTVSWTSQTRLLLPGISWPQKWLWPEKQMVKKHKPIRKGLTFYLVPKSDCICNLCDYPCGTELPFLFWMVWAWFIACLFTASSTDWVESLLSVIFLILDL